MVEKDDLNIPMIATTGVVSVIATVVIVIGVQALYHTYAGAENQRKVIAVPTVDSNSKLAEQDAKLARYGWVSREQNTVSVPIERAMTLVVRDLQAQRNARDTSPK